MSPSRLAVKIIFFLNGFVHANYFSRLPRIQDQFAINDGILGLVLLSSSIGALFAMPFTGWLIIRNGSRRITIFSAFAYCALIVFIPKMPVLAGLVILFFLLGITSGMLDVAMNSQAVMVEKQLGKPIMTSFHALFSIGMMMGAFSGSLFAKLDTGLFIHFGAISLISVIVVLIARYYLIHDKPASKAQEGPAFRLPNAAMVSIGIIAFCSMLGEGAMADWSTNYMENIAHADRAIAPLGLSAFAMAMTIGRLFGDGARVRYGDKSLMVVCGLVASVGLTLAILFTNPFAVIGGLFVVGIGLSAIVPIAYSIAGHTRNLPPGVGLAMVTTVGYSGFLFGPPIIGLLADMFTLRYALLLAVILFVVMTVLSLRYNSEKV
ncbi:MAG: MFS transporter [Cyclobacteriaceae bacterium]|nr:MFS transporter [Cyclobacteriaceae bacterium]HQQ82922.1 MFS transporter [Cyclobacteriaceae bacterium]